MPYQQQEGKEVFLTRAHAVGLETEALSYAEAVAISRRVRQAGLNVTNQSLLLEVRDRDVMIQKLQRQTKKKRKLREMEKQLIEQPSATNIQFQHNEAQTQTLATVKQTSTQQDESSVLSVKPRKPVPNVPVLDYEQMKREAGEW